MDEPVVLKLAGTEKDETRGVSEEEFVARFLEVLAALRDGGGRAA